MFSQAKNSVTVEGYSFSIEPKKKDLRYYPHYQFVTVM